MDKLHLDVLNEMRKKIIDDVDIYNGVIHPLQSQYVLRNNDVERITSPVSKRARAEILLDTLPSCGPYAFGVFHEALRKQYSWLSNDIDDILRSKQINVPDNGRSVSPGSPNLPPQPSLNIEREEKIKQLKLALQNIEPGCYLALHGMKGFGKSCLTANTLKDTALVKTCFTNQVYWIKFGYERTEEDEILIQLNYLYHQVKNSDTLTTNVHADALKGHLVNSLKNYFGKEANRNALLVLDDVWSKKIIDDFDFHCKTLVITDDSDFLDGKEHQVIQMKDGFTEAESLGLFAKVLQIEVSKLPPEAKKIHEECNGMPILIAMFAAQFEEFKDDMKMSRNRWKHYLDSLRAKDPTNRVIERFLSKQTTIFDLCINKLDQDVKSKYEALAIFSQDVNIMPQTLSILWGGDNYIVEEQMVNLCHKSLAAKHWNVDLKSYVYGVHDLLLCHLRKKLGAKRLVKLHRSFINKLQEYCNGDFSKLPNDNYSFSYIGHHLEQAKMYNKFPNLYLDFAFLKEKIYHTGLSDLLIDLNKYRKWIARDNESVKAQVIDLEKFLENRAGVIAEQSRRRCLDLIQIGMNYTSKRFVYNKTRELAKLDDTKIFVTHDGPSFSLYPNDEIPTEAKTAYFTDDPDEILIGNYSGQVVLWNCKTRSQKLFSGHNEQTAIRKIIVSNSGHYFLTLCDHGEVQIFKFPVDENTPKIQSPREKQKHWADVFNGETPKSNSERKFCLDEKITDMALVQRDGELDRIGVCSNGGTFRVWTIDGNVIYTKKEKSCNFERILFTRNGRMLHLLDDDGVLKFYAEHVEKTGTKYSYLSTWNPKIKETNEKIIFIQDVPDVDRVMTTMVIVTESKVVWVQWINVFDEKDPNLVEQIRSYEKRSKIVLENDDPRFTCATLTYDGNYLITANAKGSIDVWHIRSAFAPITTFTGRVNSLDTYWQGDEFHLICGCDRNAIYRWEFSLAQLPKSVRKPLFDAVINPWGKDNIVAKEVPTGGNTTTISLYHGNAIVGKTVPVIGGIIRLCLNKDGDQILYATDNRMIILYDLNSDVSRVIFELNSGAGIVTFLSMGESTFVVCGENENLKIWSEEKLFQLEKTGYVTSIHKIDDSFVVTVERKGIIKFFQVDNTNWTVVHEIECRADNEKFCHSSINEKANLICVLMANSKMIIYEIIKDTSVKPTNLGATEYVKLDFDQKLTCCEFSKDDNYLAIGLANGDISIFHITGRCELSRLHLHCNEVREFHWAPTSIGAPILLSVNCDELAWWNVSLLFENKTENRRSRMGLSRSTSTLGISPRSSVRLSASQSMNFNISNDVISQLSALTVQKSYDGESRNEETNETGDNGHRNGETYWNGKTAKQSNIKALLAVVPLPPSCNSKVCVSGDFSKFLSVDIHGIVSNFQFYNYNQ